MFTKLIPQGLTYIVEAQICCITHGISTPNTPPILQRDYYLGNPNDIG